MIDVVVIVLLTAALLGSVVMVVGEFFLIRGLRRYRLCRCGWITVPDGWGLVHDVDKHLVHSVELCQPCREVVS